MNPKTVHEHRTLRHIVVISDNPRDQPKLKRRGFHQLGLSPDPDDRWYVTAMALDPGAYSVKMEVDELVGMIYTTTPLAEHPLHYTTGQWGYITASQNGKTPGRRRS